jgi:hypothetical protein
VWQFLKFLFFEKLDVAVVDELYFDSLRRDFGNFSPVPRAVIVVFSGTFLALFLQQQALKRVKQRKT